MTLLFSDQIANKARSFLSLVLQCEWIEATQGMRSNKERYDAIPGLGVHGLEEFGVVLVPFLCLFSTSRLTTEDISSTGRFQPDIFPA